MAKKVLYYNDLKNDDFAAAALAPKPLPENLVFAKTGFFWRIAEFFAYRIIATPLVWLIGKIGFGLRIKNRKALRKLRGTGYYLYGNHTQDMMDAYTPTLVTFPKFAHIGVSPQAVSSAPLSLAVRLLGGIPIPGIKRMREFVAALSLRIRCKRAVAIYPEAHIWPWYTGIRPFPNGSFTYPVRDGVPAVAFVTTYRRRKVFKNLPPCLTVTVSEPFYPDSSLGEREAKQKLRDQVYAFMCGEAAKPGNYAHYVYIKKDPEAKEAASADTCAVS